MYNNDTELIQSAIEGNRSSQKKLYDTFAPKMLSVCRQYIKDVHQAEDVMISAFFKAFQNLKKFENKGSFEGWLRRIMVNDCITFLRQNKKITFIEDQTIVEESVQIDDSFSVEILQSLIDNLPDGYKMVFNLYAIEGYKHNEIATMLNISEGTSKSQLSHARKLLQKQINNSKTYNNAYSIL